MGSELLSEAPNETFKFLMQEMGLLLKQVTPGILPICKW